MEQLGKYEILGVIGEGGMGAVYRARDAVIGRDVAIKVIQERALNVPEVKERFYREAQAAGRLSHENIMVIHDIGEEDGTPYIVMELLTGTDLRRLLDSGEKLSLDQKLLIAIQIGEGLLYAHQHNVVHRDVKPDNIRILRGNRVKIMDFGIARLTAEVHTLTHASLGTPRYMSPEQIKGLRVDNRSDIFSFGVLLYELLTGTNPFWGEHVTTVIYKILHEEPEPIELDDAELASDLQDILSRCLSKDVNGRYQTLEPLLRDLRSALLKRQHPDRTFQLPTHALLDETVALPVDPADSDRRVTSAVTESPPAGTRGTKSLMIGVAAVVVAAILVIVFVERPGGNAEVRPEESVASADAPPAVVDISILRDEALAAQQRMNDEKVRADEAESSAGEGTTYAQAVEWEARGQDLLSAGDEAGYRQAEEAFARAADLYADAALSAAGDDVAALREQAESLQREVERVRTQAAGATDEASASSVYRRAERARADGATSMQRAAYADAIRSFRSASASFVEATQIAQRQQALRSEAGRARDEMELALSAVADARGEASLRPLLDQADGLRQQGSAHLDAGAFDRAATAFGGARDLYRRVAERRNAEVTGEREQLWVEAEQLQQRVQTARTAVAADWSADADYQRATDLMARGSAALSAGSYEEAAGHFRQAEATFGALANREPAPAPAAVVQETVQVLVSRLKSGFEDKDLPALRALSPVFGSWSDFFNVAHSITANVSSSDPEVSGDRARVRMQIQLEYLDNKNRAQRTPPLNQMWTLERSANEWAVVGVVPGD